jgi:hypothetical protein
VDEEPRRIQVHVAGEVDVLDADPFQGRGLLLAHVRRQEQNPVAGVFARQLCAATNQLAGNHRGVQVAEVALLLDQIADRPPRDSKDEQPVERCHSSRRSAHLGLGQPPLESGPVRFQICRLRRSSHVRNFIMFISNELDHTENTLRT